MKLVLDVSNNTPIGVPVLKESGSVALLAKATEGTGFRDAYLGTHRSAARIAGKPFGSYLFLHPDSVGSEAQYYLDYAQPRRGDIQPIIDAETLGKGGFGTAAARVNSCAEALEDKGYKPILYASASFWQWLIKADPTLKRLFVWEAQYPGRFTRWFPWLAAKRIRLFHGVSVVLWQWTDSFAVGGRHYDASALLTEVKNLLIP